jgi:flavin reductase (DIM6/NTAB) family NADH-FMN oxidoreductase RutF
MDGGHLALSGRQATNWGADPVLFRQAMRQLVSGVTIVATRDELGLCHGMTATSFRSVSLDPPLVSVCIARRSGSFAAFSACPAFGISILGRQHLDVALRFAQRRDDKFDGLPFDEHLDRAPVLEGSASTFSCTVSGRLPVGDHLILVGQVRSCRLGAVRSLLAHGMGQFFEVEPRSRMC